MGLFDSILTGEPQEQKLKDLVAAHALPLAVRKTTWYGDFYFLVEEITWNGRAKGTRYSNGNVYGRWSCSLDTLFILNEQDGGAKKSSGPLSSETKKESEIKANPNNLIMDKSRYISGATKLFVQRKDRLAPAVFDHFEVKNGKDVIYVECEGKLSFYAFPNTEFVFPNKDDGAAALAKKNRSHETSTDSARIISAYSKLPMAQKPSDQDDVEHEYEAEQHKKVNDKLLQDLISPRQSISSAEDTLTSASSDYRDACIEARENGGFFDEHTFISLQIRSSNAQAQIASAEREIDRIETVRSEPYFARVDCGKSAKELHTAYLGDADIPGYVVDWRHQEIGNAYYYSNILQSRDDIVIALRRTFTIQHARFLGFDDDVNIYHSGSLRVSDNEIAISFISSNAFC